MRIYLFFGCAIVLLVIIFTIDGRLRTDSDILLIKRDSARIEKICITMSSNANPDSVKRVSIDDPAVLGNINRLFKLSKGHAVSSDKSVSEDLKIYVYKKGQKVDMLWMKTSHDGWVFN